jgi:cytochrome oxidase Cu insertion factor (SCO1/SenC/PrrC family)
MKKASFRVLLVFTGLVICVLIGIILMKQKAHKHFIGSISRLPAFTLATLDGRTFNSSDLRTGPVLIIHFHPDCEHCQYEISELFNHVSAIAETNLILISSAPKADLENLLNQYSYSRYSNISILRDTSDTFDRIFRSSIIPSHFLYNKDLELIKAFPGEYKLETILKYIDEDEVTE